MSFISIGDLAQSLQLRRDNARLSARFDELTRELSTGRTARLDDAVGGDYRALAAFDSGIAKARTTLTSLSEFALETDARQTALSSIREATDRVAGQLLLLQGAPRPTLEAEVLSDAAQAFDRAVAQLNTQIGGRSLFAGTRVDGPALPPASDILNSAEAVIVAQGAVTAADIEAALDDWLAPGGDFDTLVYRGGPPVSGDTAGVLSLASVAPTAATPELRGLVKGFVTSALLERGLTTATPEDRETLLRRSGDILLNAREGVLSLQAQVGTMQENLDVAIAETAAERDGLEVARASLTEIDPFEVASEIEAVETQLRSLYVLTSKMSGLSLTDYLR
ncbi:hypothetical protein GQ651_09910 [Alphaproteobacteria bacterium GH1-50]|uniref:Flagellin C-terminal domain-containing protein n=1 Tax=Kangsaoukella pontilimi TaxID=2691042 RepID=A0A7C9MG68_9RHOB|nr:flagellin [Kangsaoukella pontilimi]MXQ08156.1 hypothetical protein [Kangsaoukella pontilimi]